MGQSQSVLQWICEAHPNSIPKAGRTMRNVAIAATRTALLKDLAHMMMMMMMLMLKDECFNWREGEMS